MKEKIKAFYKKRKKLIDYIFLFLFSMVCARIVYTEGYKKGEDYGYDMGMAIFQSIVEDQTHNDTLVTVVGFDWVDKDTVYYILEAK